MLFMFARCPKKDDVVDLVDVDAVCAAVAVAVVVATVVVVVVLVAGAGYARYLATMGLVAERLRKTPSIAALHLRGYKGPTKEHNHKGTFAGNGLRRFPSDSRPQGHRP